MRKRRLVGFFLIMFALSWGIPAIALLLSWTTGAFDVSLDRYSPLYYLFFWSPALSALIVVTATQGREGLRSFLRDVFSLRFKWRWWTAVIVGVPLLKLLAWVLAEDPSAPGSFDTTLTWAGLMVGGMLAATAAPVGEIGWRGFALPLLQRRGIGLFAAVIIGSLWSLWYVPWLLPGTVMNWSLGGDSIPAILRFFAGGIALSIIVTVIFNGSGGSIPLAFLFHWLNGYPHMWESGSHVAYIDTVAMLTTAGILVFILRRRYLWRSNLFTGVATYEPESGECS